MKFNEKIISRKLRNKGKSYDEISKITNVSKSTLSRWLVDIELTKKQQESMLKGREKSRYAAGRAKHNEKLKRIKQITESSKEEVRGLLEKPLFLIGLSLYLAEGDKHSQERVKFTNSDSDLVKIMMDWFRKICKVPERKFRIALHIHDLHSNKNLVNYWSKITRIPKKQFYKVFVKQTSLEQRRNILYNGTCAILVNNKDLFRKIKGWQAGVFEILNIKSP